MRSYKPDKIATEILKCIGKQMYQAQIVEDMKIKKQALYSRIIVLKKYGYIKKGQRGASLELKLTDKGVKAISITSRGDANTFTSIPQSKAMQRPHAMQVNALLFRTSSDRIKPTMDSIGIPYRIELRGNMMRLSWQGKELRATRTYLYTVVQLEQMPINIPIEEVKHKAIEKAGAYMESFLAKTGLRCLRDRLGNLKLEVRYFENGYPENEIAEESLKDKSRIVYAYDLKTGKARAWADSSLGDLKELETNSDRIDTQVKLFLQATENGEIKPYEDEINTRKDIAGLIDLANKQALANAGTLELVKEIREELKIHRSAYQALERVAKRLDDTLKQRKL